MPQMMPINWILSLFLFILTFIIFNIMNYYIFIYKNNNFNNFFISKTKKSLNWMW